MVRGQVRLRHARHPERRHRDALPVAVQHFRKAIEYDSLYWLIAKCCAPDPADRFASVDELRTQVLGVLREDDAQGVVRSHAPRNGFDGADRATAGRSIAS